MLTLMVAPSTEININAGDSPVAGSSMLGACIIQTHAALPYLAWAFSVQCSEGLGPRGQTHNKLKACSGGHRGRANFRV